LQVHSHPGWEFTIPYPRAHYFIALVLIATIVGFWPSYFGNITDAPMAFHVHGIVATAWVVLVAFQSWSIHAARNALHRNVGMASLVLFPLLTGSLVMIANVSASGYAEGGPYYGLLGPIFGYATAIPLIAYIVLFAQALRYRRQVYRHSGYMLGTVFFLWEPAAARLLIRFFPPMAIDGPADFHKVGDAIALGIVLPLLLAIYLYLRHPKVGMPFLVAAVLLGVQMGGIYWIADTAMWDQVFGWYAGLPTTITVGSGVFLGALSAWAGWKFGAQP
jgi:hypothetical protein